MNLKDAIDIVSEETNLPREEVDEVLKKFIEVVGEALNSGHEVLIQNLGRFGWKFAPEKRYRDPRTGEMMVLSDGFRLFFRPSRKLPNRMS